jgi:hypothetical protein
MTPPSLHSSFESLVVFLREKSVISLVKACLQRIHLLCTFHHGSPSKALSLENVYGLARAGGAVRRSETFISISDRQLPPGHDPGADYGEAPHGRQRGSRPCNILVESRGYLMPRRDERPR